MTTHLSLRRTPAEFYRELGVLVREAREEQGWSQRDLAAYLRIGRSTLTKLEAGRGAVPGYTLVALLDVLDILLPYVDPPPGQAGYRRTPDGVGVSTSA